MPSEASAVEPGLQKPAGLWKKALSALLALAMFGMMALTFVDVIGRYILSRPVPGSSELVQVLMAVVIAAGVPLVTLSREHISIGLLRGFFTGRGRWLLDALIMAGSIALLAFLAYCLWQQVVALHRSQMGTTFLGIPIAPVALLLSVMIAFTGLIEAAHLYRHLRKRSRSA